MSEQGKPAGASNDIRKEPDWTLNRLAIKLKARAPELAAELSKALNDMYLDRIATEKYHSERMIEWLNRGGEHAVTSFTSGPQRNIAYAVEELVARKTGKPVVRP